MDVSFLRRPVFIAVTLDLRRYHIGQSRVYRNISYLRRPFDVFFCNIRRTDIVKFRDHLFHDFRQQLPTGQEPLGVLVILCVIVAV